MDFTNRGQQNNTPQRRGAAFSPNAPEDAPVKPKPENSGGGLHLDKNSTSKWAHVGSGVLVIVIAVLVAAALALVILTKPRSETSFVDGSNLQAVFLTNDQVYFGNITSISKDYIALNNIYYLQSSANSTNKASANNNISLIKLGCELHKPQDRMIINQSQVNFWENLQSDGQVAKLVKQDREANPNGQNCDNNSSSNPVQGSANTTSNTPANTDTTNTTDTNTNNTTKNQANQ